MGDVRPQAGSRVPGTPIIVWVQLLAEQIGALLITKGLAPGAEAMTKPTP